MGTSYKSVVRWSEGFRAVTTAFQKKADFWVDTKPGRQCFFLSFVFSKCAEGTAQAFGEYLLQKNTPVVH